MKDPAKTILITESKSFDFDWTSKKVALQYFMQWCKENVPTGAQDVTLELMEDWQYDDCQTYLEIAWKREVPNPRYEKELKKFNKVKGKK
jgi:hypothetical protein